MYSVDEIRNWRRKQKLNAHVQSFSNDCHDPANGRFCETHGWNEWGDSLKTATNDVLEEDKNSLTGKPYWITSEGKLVRAPRTHADLVPDHLKGDNIIPQLESFAKSVNAIRVRVRKDETNIILFSRPTESQIKTIVEKLVRPKMLVGRGDDGIGGFVDSNESSIRAAIEKQVRLLGE